MTAADIKLLEAKIKEDAKNSNDLTKIVAFMGDEDRHIAHAAVQSLRRLFVYFAEKGDLRVPDLNKAADPLEKYAKWLWDHYVSFLTKVVDWLHDENENTQVLALRTMMEIVSRQESFKGVATEQAFGNDTFMRVVRKLVTLPELKGELLSVFKGEFLDAYIDVQYYTVKNMAQILDSTTTKSSPSLVRNSLVLLDTVELPDSSEDINDFFVEPKDLETSNDATDDNEDEDEVNSDSDDEEPVNQNNKRPRDASKDDKPAKKSRQDGSIRDAKQHARVFSNCWIALLKHPLPEDTYKSILVKLPEDVMPYLTDPLLLADFLTDSYNVGGLTSLLALNSLFELIHRYNFDYPDFFPKLYKLLGDDSLLRSKYRKRFFKLLTLFLTSTYLPAYMVAAFAKRLARLSLTAEPGAIMFLIPCVYNLILRHKECIQLIHRTYSQTVAEKAAEKREMLTMKNEIDAAAAKLTKESHRIELKGGLDPFNNDIDDPAACEALKSSLWEMVSLKNHYHAGVATKAKMFEEKLRTQMLELGPDMDVTYPTLIEQSLKRREKQQVPLAFEGCTGVFSSDDVFSKIFAF